jgi:5-methyltetrahydrofolate--homocysteine methyltransferase
MFESLLATGRPLLADGATGTNLFAMGLASGESPELWSETHRDKILSLHRSFVDAGADIILTNSFGGNRRRLALHGLDGRVGELNRRAAEIAREAADRAGRAVAVAGSVGPTGDLLAPLGRWAKTRRPKFSPSKSRASKLAAPTSSGSKPCRRPMRCARRRRRPQRST